MASPCVLPVVVKVITFKQCINQGGHKAYCVDVAAKCSYFCAPSRVVDLAEYLSLDTHVHSSDRHWVKRSNYTDRPRHETGGLHENFIATVNGICKLHRPPETLEEVECMCWYRATRVT